MADGSGGTVVNNISTGASALFPQGDVWYCAFHRQSPSSCGRNTKVDGRLKLYCCTVIQA